MAGDVRAEKTGDLTFAPAPRKQFDEHIVASCGGGGTTEEGAERVRRMPYLQQVTARSAKLLFTTTNTSEARISVTAVDGSVVGTFVASQDASASGSGSTQWVAELQGLQPKTLYCYEVDGLTARTGFTTAPEAGSGAAVRFVAFGDSGTGKADQKTVLSQMLTVPFDFWLHTGDVAYGEGKASQLESKHFAVYKDVLSKFPSYLALGNHDYQTESGGPYLRAFALPENGAASGGKERWYSFDWGDVHFVALDSQRINGEQVAWLDRDLAENDKPWTVVIVHKPPFSNGDHGGTSAVRAHFVPLFEKHGVQLVIAGHEHNYERFVPINGVTYVVTGGGGNLTREVGWGSTTAFSEAVLHFVYVEVEGDRMVLHTIDATGQEFDSAAIWLSAS